MNNASWIQQLKQHLKQLHAPQTPIPFSKTFLQTHTTTCSSTSITPSPTPSRPPQPSRSSQKPHTPPPPPPPPPLPPPPSPQKQTPPTPPSSPPLPQKPHPRKKLELCPPQKAPSPSTKWHTRFNKHCLLIAHSSQEIASYQKLLEAIENKLCQTQTLLLPNTPDWTRVRLLIGTKSTLQQIPNIETLSREKKLPPCIFLPQLLESPESKKALWNQIVQTLSKSF